VFHSKEPDDKVGFVYIVLQYTGSRTGKEAGMIVVGRSGTYTYDIGGGTFAGPDWSVDDITVTECLTVDARIV